MNNLRTNKKNIKINNTKTNNTHDTHTNPKQRFTRERLLQKSAEIFYRQGYHGASIQMIATACQTSKSTLYNYFDSKDALLLAMIEHLCHQFDHQVIQPVLHQHPTQSRAQCLAMLSTRLQAFFLSRDHAVITRISHEIVAINEVIRTRIQAYFDSWQALIYRVLLPLTGHFTAEATAKHSVAFLQGLLILSRVWHWNQRELKQHYDELTQYWVAVSPSLRKTQQFTNKLTMSITERGKNR